MFDVFLQCFSALQHPKRLNQTTENDFTEFGKTWLTLIKCANYQLYERSLTSCPCLPFMFPQVQATVLGFLAALAASALGGVIDKKLSINSAGLLCCSSVVTAFTASILQGKNTIFTWNMELLNVKPIILL